MMKSEHAPGLPTYPQYPIGFPFYHTLHNRGQRSDSSYMEKLNVNTNHPIYDDPGSPPLSASSTASTTLPVLTHALSTPPLVTSPWKTTLADTMETQNSPTLHTNKCEPESQSECNQKKSCTSIVSHSIERLMSDSANDNKTSEQSSDAEALDEPTDVLNRAEPDSTQPDVDTRTTDKAYHGSHGCASDDRHRRKSDGDSEGTSHWPSMGGHPSKRSSPSLLGSSSIPPVGNFPGVHPAALLYQYNQYSQYAAVQQYAQQVAHQVAVAQAQFQAAHRAAAIGINDDTRYVQG